MASTAVKQNIGENYRAKKMGLKEKFGHPDFILEQISQCVKDGDFASITDFISSYVSNSPKYKSQDEFAEAIGTTRQTLHRMFAHENVSLNILFNALEQIHADQTAIAQPVDSKKFLEKARGALKKHRFEQANRILLNEEDFNFAKSVAEVPANVTPKLKSAMKKRNKFKG